MAVTQDRLSRYGAERDVTITSEPSGGRAPTPARRPPAAAAMTPGRTDPQHVELELVA